MAELTSGPKELVIFPLLARSVAKLSWLDLWPPICNIDSSETEIWCWGSFWWDLSIFCWIGWDCERKDKVYKLYKNGGCSLHWFWFSSSMTSSLFMKWIVFSPLLTVSILEKKGVRTIINPVNRYTWINLYLDIIIIYSNHLSHHKILRKSWRKIRQICLKYIQAIQEVMR